MSAITQIPEDWLAIGPSAIKICPALVKRLRRFQNSGGVRISVSDKWLVEEAADMIEVLCDFSKYLVETAAMAANGEAERITCDEAKLKRPEKYCRMGRCENEEWGGEPCTVWLSDHGGDKC